jgi:hypothetical protein
VRSGFCLKFSDTTELERDTESRQVHPAPARRDLRDQAAPFDQSATQTADFG